MIGQRTQRTESIRLIYCNRVIIGLSSALRAVLTSIESVYRGLAPCNDLHVGHRIIMIRYPLVDAKISILINLRFLSYMKLHLGSMPNRKESLRREQL